MKRKKVGTFLVACCMAAMLFGCASTFETGETVIVPKAEAATGNKGLGTDHAGTAAQEAEKSAGGAEKGQSGTAGKIADQVKAPQTYQDTVSGGNVRVTVDAAVVVPDADGFRKKRVKPRAFTQQDYDTVNNALLGGGKLWDRDVEAMGGIGVTKEELQRKIDWIKAEMAAGAKESDLYGDKDVTYGETLAQLEGWIKDAPEKVVTAEKDTTVRYEPGNDAGNRISGYVTADGIDYMVWLDNSMRDGWYWNRFTVEKPGEGGNYVQGTDEDAKDASFSTQEIRKQAETLVAKLGLTEYGYAGEEYFISHGGEDADGTSKKADTGYCIHFTRRIDSIPVTYATGEGMYGKAGDVSWPAEHLNLIYDESGVVCLDWESPYEIEDVSDEYVFLLPFSDIQDVFKKMVVEKYRDLERAEYHIDRVQLGYMRVRKNGTETEGLMIPVWDFFGTGKVYVGGVENTAGGNAIESIWAYESLLTVNAMDGSIVDKKLGY